MKFRFLCIILTVLGNFKEIYARWRNFVVKTKIVLGLLLITMFIGTLFFSSEIPQNTSKYMISEVAGVSNSLQTYANVTFSTFLGGAGDEYASSANALPVADMTTDANGNTIIVARTTSSDFPTENAYQENATGGYDVVIAKYDPTGSIIFSTYFGGSGDDWGTSIQTDSSGDIYIMGTSDSSDLPLVNSYQNYIAGGLDIFVAKISADGQELLYSTFIGGSNGDWGYGIALDSSDNMIITGSTFSTDFPTSNPIQDTIGGGGSGVDAFITKLSTDGQSLVFSTYLGAIGHDWGWDIITDSQDNIIFTGGTALGSFTTSGAFQEDPAGGYDVHVTKISSSGTMVFSTLIGGSVDDRGRTLSLDNEENILVTGSTSSNDFPTKTADQKERAGGQEAFLAKLKADGTALLASTYLGGSGSEEGFGVQQTPSGKVIVIGETTSADFPSKAHLHETNEHNGAYDGFIAIYSQDCKSLLSASFFGAEGNDYPRGLSVNGNKFSLLGYTSSSGFPVKNAHQAFKAGQYDLFITQLEYDLSELTAPSSTPFNLILSLISLIGFTIVTARRRK